MDCPFDHISVPPLSFPGDMSSDILSMDGVENLHGADMLPFQSDSASSSCQHKERFSQLDFKEAMLILDQSSGFTFIKLLEEDNGMIVEELQTIDPFHFKLPMLMQEAPKHSESPAEKVVHHDQFVEAASSLVAPASNESAAAYHREEEEEEDEVGHAKELIVSSTEHEEAPKQRNSSNADSSEKRMEGTRLANLFCGGSSGSSSGTDTQKSKKNRANHSCKNNELETLSDQRQIHIAVERKRRKQMNEHLHILRSLMPGSYVQRGDQASIIGGAIAFVKELEQLLECLQTQKRRRTYAEAFSPKPNKILNPTAYNPLVTSANHPQLYSLPPADHSNIYVNDNFLYEPLKQGFAEFKSELAEVEVRAVGAEVLVKILSERRPGQLLKTISALESLNLTIVHINVTTIDKTVLCSFTVTLGRDCNLDVDDIASSVHHIFTTIHTGGSKTL